MYFDTSDLDFITQMHFLEYLEEHKKWLEDAYYKVFYDKLADKFLLVKIDYVIHR